MMRFYFAALSLLMCFSTQATTFTQLQLRVWQRDADTHQAQQQLSAASQIADHNRRWFNDGASVQFSEQRNTDERALYEQQWEISLPSPFTSSALSRSKHAAVSAQQWQVELAKISASAQLYRLLGQHKTLRELTALQAQRRDTATRLLADIEQRWRAGEAAPDDVRQLQIEQQLASSEWQRSDAQHRDVLLQLQALTGVDLENVEVALPTIVVNDNEHPLLQRIRAEQQQAQAQREWAQDWSRLFNWQLLYKKERSDLSGITDTSAGFGVSIPLGLDAEQRDERVQALSDEARAQHRLQQLQQQLPLQRQRALLTVRQTEQYWQQQQQIAQWQQAHADANDNAWRHGEKALVDALRAHEKLWQSRIQVVVAEQEWIDANADYLVAAGVLP